MKSKATLVFFLSFLLKFGLVFSQEFTHAARDAASNNQSFNSVSTLSNGNVVATTRTDLSSFYLQLSLGAAHSDNTGKESIICFNNNLSSVEWFVTSRGNSTIKCWEVVVDDEDNSYARFSGPVLPDPFVLNSDTLYPEQPTGCTIIVKINKFGEVVWTRKLDGFTHVGNRLLKIANNTLFVLTPFSSDITNPLTGEVLSPIGGPDYYLTKISFENEVLDLLHIYCGDSFFNIFDYAISQSGNISFATKTSMNVIINGTTMYSSSPELIDTSLTLEVNSNGSELLNSTYSSNTNIKIMYNLDDHLVAAGIAPASSVLPVIADTHIVTSCKKMYIAEFTSDFELEWINHFAMLSGYCGDAGFFLEDIKEDCRGSYYLAGKAEGVVNFDSFTFSESSFLANNWGDAYILRLNSEAVPTWLGFGGGESFSDQFNHIAIDNAGNAFVAGFYSRDCSFGPLVLGGGGGGMHTNSMLLRIGNTISDHPLADLSLLDSVICLGDTAFLSFETTNAVSYFWNPVDMSDSLTFVPIEAQSYTYSLTAVDSSGCENKKSVELVVLPHPTIATSFITPENLGSDGAIDITVEGGSPEYLFDWDIDESGDFDDEEDINDLNAGIYTVIIADSNGCQVTVSFEVGNLLSSPSPETESIQIYPNPAQDWMSINLNGNFSLELFDNLGNLIQYGENYLSNVNLDLSRLPNGHYHLRIYSGELTYNYQFIKQAP